MFKLFDFLKKEEAKPEVQPEKPRVPDEIDLQMELNEINMMADQYIALCQKNLKMHTAKYVEYKTKKLSGYDFAKDELIRMLANRKCMENAQRFKDTMQHRFMEYKRGIMSTQLMENMAKFADSIRYTMSESGGNLDSSEYAKSIHKATAMLDRTQEQINNTMSLFESATFDDAAEYVDDAANDIEKSLERVLQDGILSDTPMSTEEITRKLMEELV